MLERFLTGLVVVALLGAVAVCAHSWRRSRRKSRQLAQIYERLAAPPVSMERGSDELDVLAFDAEMDRLHARFDGARPVEVAKGCPAGSRPFISMARPPSELRPRIAVGPVRERYPTVMNLPAARVSDDADDDLWLRRSLDIHVVHVPAPAINAASPSEPRDFEGQGGSFGGAGASGGWEPANDAPAAPDPAPAVDTPTADFGGDFSNDP